MKNLENDFYNSVIGLCEQLEGEGIYKGNGHHLAQKLVTCLSKGMLPKQQRIIFDSLYKTPQTSKQIGEKCGLSSKIVSSQLKSIYDKSSLLLSYSSIGRIKKWYLY